MRLLRFRWMAQDDYSISPDSTEVAFTMNVDADQAISTNSDIYTVPMAGGEPKKITVGWERTISRVLAGRQTARISFAATGRL